LPHELLHAAGCERHMMFRRERARIVRVARRYADQSSTLRVRDRLRMEVGDHADADDAEAERGKGHGGPKGRKGRRRAWHARRKQTKKTGQPRAKNTAAQNLASARCSVRSVP